MVGSKTPGALSPISCRRNGSCPMSDAPNLNQPGPKKELSTEMRLLIAFALMGIVLFATPYFFKSVAPPPPPKKPTAAQPLNPAVETPALSAAAKPDGTKRAETN